MVISPQEPLWWPSRQAGPSMGGDINLERQRRWNRLILPVTLQMPAPTDCLLTMRSPVRRSVIAPLKQPLKSGRCTVTAKSLLIVPFLLALPACSTMRVIAPMPQLPANLAAQCQTVPAVPTNDPDRVVWEIDLLNAYADCAMKHRLTVEAWPKK